MMLHKQSDHHSAVQYFPREGVSELTDRAVSLEQQPTPRAKSGTRPTKSEIESRLCATRHYSHRIFASRGTREYDQQGRLLIPSERTTRRGGPYGIVLEVVGEGRMKHDAPLSNGRWRPGCRAHHPRTAQIEQSFVGRNSRAMPQGIHPFSNLPWWGIV